MIDKNNIIPVFKDTGIFIDREAWGDAYKFLIYSRDARTQKHIIMPPTDWDFQPDEATSAIIPPTFTIPIFEVQKLMDALWNIGIRPSNGIHSPGELKATERHLEDARELNKKLLDKVLKDD